MCGIVAAVADRNIVPLLIEGLTRLEYRGYDSAGIAVRGNSPDGALTRMRSIGRVADLAAQAQDCTATAGIAHTRWATHGVPSERNAHPLMSGGLALVHNGIIENYVPIRQMLIEQGYEFVSETDTEVIAHLVQHEMKTADDLLSAVRRTCAQLVGAFGIAVIRESDDCVVVARRGSPLLLGLGEHGNYAASDASALLSVTRNIVYLEEGDVAEIKRESVRIFPVGAGDTGRPTGRKCPEEGKPLVIGVDRPIHVSTLSADAVDLGNYQHFMQKEIFEQPEALAATLEMIGGAQSLTPNIFGANAPEVFAGIDSVLILACGTSYHSGLVARYWIEQLAGIRCTVEIASEYRYRVSVPAPTQLVIAISQSGETADTLASVKYAKSLGMQRTLAICNAPESAIVRECELRFLTRAGPEIGVASTKAFTTQLAALFVLAVTLAKANARLSPTDESKFLTNLRHLPLAVQKVLALEPQIASWSLHFADKHHALFLGRGLHYPIALEGALKLKEISYIHAEGYPAGELKHGPLALVDANMPVITIAPNDALLEKLKSNLMEVAARGGELYVFADTDSAVTAGDAVHVLRLPENYGLLSPVLHVVALQLLSYHVALVKGTDVDKPRNLAKSVTVE